MDNLMIAILEYMEKSSKKDYMLSEEEYLRLSNQIQVLQKHLDLMYDYEMKRNG